MGLQVEKRVFREGETAVFLFPEEAYLEEACSGEKVLLQKIKTKNKKAKAFSQKSKA